MPRYEDGKRFWHVSLTGLSVSVTAGKIGQKGRTTVKRLANAGAARSHYDEIVIAKLRAGYHLVEAAEPAAVEAPDDPDDRIDALEARLAEDPADREAWMVYG